MIEIKTDRDHIPRFSVLVSEETKNERNSIDATYANTSRLSITESQMPFYKDEVSYNLPIYSVINTYAKTCKKHGFLITEQTPYACTAYYTQRCSIKTLISCCLGKPSKIKITSAKLSIGSNPRSQLRIIYVKGLHGDIKLLARLIKTFQKNLELDLKLHEQLKYQQVEEEEEEIVITCKNESYSYYEIYKILSCEAYSLGKSVSEFCESFTSQYRNAVESSRLLPQPLHSIQTMIDYTIESLFSHYNYGKKNTEKVMQYCRPAVEKYIFTKLHTHLILIYQAKFAQQDSLIAAKQEALKNLSTAQLMKALSIPEQFNLCEEKNPYEEAIEILKKINENVTPAEKLNCVISFEAAMKSAVVEYWKSHVELDSNSACLVSKYIIIKANVKSPHAEIGLIDDYLKDKYDEEKTVVLNFERSLRHIIN